MCKKTKGVVAIEENTKFGGVFSDIAELLSENHPVLIKSIYINDEFGMSGEPEELIEIFKFTEIDIFKKSLELVKYKDYFIN